MAAVYAKSTLGMGALPLVLCKLTILPRNIHSSVNDFAKDDLRASKIDWHGENDWEKGDRDSQLSSPFAALRAFTGLKTGARAPRPRCGYRGQFEAGRQRLRDWPNLRTP